MMMHEYGGMMGYGYGGYGTAILGLVTWILIIAGLVLLLKWLFEKTGPTESALDIARKRYARGEISKEEFEEMKRQLEK